MGHKMANPETHDIQDCPCTKLTGEARHDCPNCGGEGLVAKKKVRDAEEEKEQTAKVCASQ